MIDRRCFVGAMLLSAGVVLSSCSSRPSESETIPLFEELAGEKAPDSENEDAVSVAFAALVSPQESFYKYQNLVAYLEKKLERPIQVVRRQTYKEVNDLLGSGGVDFGFICSLSFVMGIDDGTLSGVAAPVINGSSFYQSYLICRADSKITALEDLAEKKFAFTDPLSYTGRLSMLKLLHDQVGAGEEYFHEVFYTYSHDSSIHAVHLGIIDGACVDGLLFEELAEVQPDLVDNIRVIYKGPAAGMPPVVASSQVDSKLHQRFQTALLEMDRDAEGGAILDELGYDRYEIPHEGNYETIREALLAVGLDAIDESSTAVRGE